MFKKLVKVFSIVLAFGMLAGLVVSCGRSSELSRVSKHLTTYHIEAVFDDEEKVIEAKEKVEYVNSTGGTLEFVCFHMYPTAFSEDANIKPYALASEVKCFPSGVDYGDMVIDSVFVEGTEAKTEIVGEDNNALKVWLVEPLENKKSVEIMIAFKTVLANCTHRLGYGDDFVNVGNWYPVACVFEDGEFDLTPYYSTGDPFFSECANYEVEFSCPKEYLVSASGVKTEQAESEGSQILHFSAKVVRDFALHLGKNVQVVTGEVEKTEVRVVCSSEDPDAGVYLQTALNAVNVFNEKFGEYPYETLTVCFTEFLHGGMEFPNLVLVSDSIDDIIDKKKVIVHEIAHQWWYGVVGNNEVDEAWIDEALAEYSTLLYFEQFGEDGVSRQSLIDEAKTNYLLYTDVVTSLDLGLNESMQLSVNEYSGEYEYVYMVYVKGVIFVDELRNAVGDEDFFGGLRRFYKKNKYGIVEKNDFVDAFEKESGLELDSFVEEWLGGNVAISEI